MKKAEKILFVEEVDPFLEDSIKAFCAQNEPELGTKTFMGKASGTIPNTGETTPDIVAGAIRSLLKIPYKPRPAHYTKEAAEAASLYAPSRELVFCAGCPHRATYWAIKNALTLDGREGFVIGDIGCYSLGIGSAGFGQIKAMLAMGSGTGLASGFGQFDRLGMEQPVLAMCGDSTFFHAAIPALVNARYNGANFLMFVLDNSATAMTGFQPHPGTGRTAMGDQAPVIDIEAVCKALGVKTEVKDPFDLGDTTETICRLIDDKEKVNVLILKQECALVRGKRQKTLYNVHVDQEKCLGEGCGCNRLCTRIFKCPGLIWDSGNAKAVTDDAICTGCGVCAEICPQSAIIKEAG